MITQEEILALQGINIELSKLVLGMQELKAGINDKSKYDNLPEWLTLEQCVQLKGGTTLSNYRNKIFLQPCCGLNYKLLGGRKVWKKEDVILWLSVTDDQLKKYAEQWNVSIPRLYEKRSA
jgi:hypothetical protein